MGENSLFSTHERFGTGYDAGLVDYPAAIYYAQRASISAPVVSTVELLNVMLGAGADTLRVDSVNDYTVTNIHGGPGDDIIEVGSSGTGLNPSLTRRVDFVEGTLNLFGDADTNTVILNDTGDDNENTGMFDENTATGLDMTGSVDFTGFSDIQILLGVASDTFYIPDVDIPDVDSGLGDPGYRERVRHGVPGNDRGE